MASMFVEVEARVARRESRLDQVLGTELMFEPEWRMISSIRSEWPVATCRPGASSCLARGT